MNRIVKIGAGAMGAITTVILWATAAYATTSPLDPISTEVDGTKDEIATFVTGTAVPVLFALLLLGVGVTLAIKYVRRGARAAG